MRARDAFLGGRLTLEQPLHGFRAGMDSVMLAAAVPAGAGDVVVELGCGAGVASLCLAARVADCRVQGFDLQEDLVALANENVALNGMGAVALFLTGSVEEPPEGLMPGSFDHAMMNPPFFVEGPADVSPHPGKRLASSADEKALARWAKAALKLLKPKGTLTAILPAERAPDMIAALARGFGGVVLFPLWPREGRPAKRVLVRAVKGSRAPFTLSPGLTLHAETGHTAKAEAVLRDGAAVEM